MKPDRMTLEEKAYFIYGYSYAQAERMKKDGLFPDFTTGDLAKLLLDEAIKDWKK